MDEITNTSTIILGVGILCVFLGVFGGGFKIKEISIPKINTASRAMGAVFGLLLIIASQFDTVMMFVNSNSPVEKKQKTEQEPEIPPPATVSASLIEKIEELKPLWDNGGITNKDILAEYIKIKGDEAFENLSLVYKSEVKNQIGKLNTSVDSIMKINGNLANELIALDGKVNDLDKFLKDDVSKVRLSQKEKSGLKKQQKTLHTMLENSVSVASKSDFLTCKKIVDKDCSQSTSRFFKDTSVSFWVKVVTPQNTEVTLKWVNLDNDNEIYSRAYSITKSTGYRLHGSKSIAAAGEYEIRLYNKENILVANKQFGVR
jgi:hypothetical protein